MSEQLSPEIEQWVNECVDSIISKVEEGCAMSIYGTAKPSNNKEFCIALNIIGAQGMMVSDTIMYDLPASVDLAQLVQISGRIVIDVEERTGVVVNGRKNTEDQSTQEQ